MMQIFNWFKQLKKPKLLLQGLVAGTIKAVYYSVIKHAEHLKTQVKCRKHEP